MDHLATKASRKQAGPFTILFPLSFSNLTLAAISSTCESGKIYQDKYGFTEIHF